MKRFEIINPTGMADIATVCDFADVSEDQIRAWARRQWLTDDPDRVLPIACDRVSRRLLYDAAAAYCLAQKRHSENPVLAI